MIDDDVDIDLINGKYVFKDKRRKDLEYETAYSLADKQDIQKRLNMRRAYTGRTWWENRTEEERQEHIMKSKIGQQRSEMIRMVKENTPTGTCVGCKQDTDNINRETLPHIVWICPSCLHLYKKHS